MIGSPIRSPIKSPAADAYSGPEGIGGLLQWDELLAWWDASEGITVTGSGVSAWVGRKRGYTLVQATDAARPAYSATGFNGSPGLTFDGTADYLSMESQPFGSDDGNFEVWAVLQNDAAGATAGNKFAVTIGAPSASGNMVRNTNNVMRSTTGASAVAEATGPFASRHVVRSIFKTGQISIAVDGGTAVTTAVDPAIGSTRTRVGSNISDAAGAFWLGKVRDVIVTSLLTTAKASDLQTFLLSRRNL